MREFRDAGQCAAPGHGDDDRLWRGQFGETLRTVGYTTFLLFYYNQAIGLSGTLTSFALGISLIVDAVSDPLVGALSDRTR
jgi:GPH family glycoside/pentoside/hexuronide:cation symporter